MGGRNGDEAAVVVLGDIGRSPRMVNHAIMIANEGFMVNIIGFFDTKPSNMVLNHPRIRIVAIAPPPKLPVPPIVEMFVKFLWNFLTLFFSLMFRTSMFNLRLIMSQNPPTFPAMPACYLVSRIKQAKYCVDWHNYMWTIIRMNEMRRNRDTEIKLSTYGRIVQLLESYANYMADVHLCVSHAMKNDLRQNWNITANVFYDRPPSWKFKECNLDDIHDVYERMGLNDGNGSTIISYLQDGNAVLKQDRPLIVVSSTSFTADEDFNILLEALTLYDEKNNRKMFVIVTGKGDLKKDFEDNVKSRNYKNVEIRTCWLKEEDYPTILASADIGVSLHESTSALDLPMKIVDMFGAKTPVLAKNYACIGELVKDGENGYVFDTANDLARLLMVVSSDGKLDELKNNFEKSKFENWEEMWNKTVKSVIV